MKTLTHRQLAILDFIQAFIVDNRYPPTYEEIRNGLGLSTKSLVNHHLNALEEAGLIERDRLTSRGLRLAGQSIHRIPVVGSIAAGLPVTAFAEPIDTAREALLLTSDIVAPQDGLFALRVRGDSMIDAMVNDGDLVVMKRQSDVRDGEMVAVWLKDRDETTLKHFFRENGQIRLQPANPTMGPIFAHPRNVEVQGKVVAVIRRVN